MTPSNVPPDLATAGKLLRSGDLSARALTETMLARADVLDPELGVFCHRNVEAARAAADRADTEMAAGTDRGPLHGIPLGIKDALLTEDAPTTMNSRLFAVDDACLRRDAPAVRRLRAAGAVPVGKTTTMELCCVYPDAAAGEAVPRNPWNRSRWAGGSSSGTAAGLAAGLFLAGVGTDTGGSVRLPASYCGVSGLKPTAGRITTEGLLPLAPGLDHIGPLARTVADCAAVFAALADVPGGNIPSPDRPGAPLRDRDLTGVRIGVEHRHHLAPAWAHPEVVRAVHDAAQKLSELGADLVETELADFDSLVDAAELISLTEAYDVHRRGLSLDWYGYSRRGRVQLTGGAAVSGADLARAHALVSRGRARVRAEFQRLDVLLLPTTVRPADPVDELLSGVEPHRTRYTRAWNALGNPAVSVPAGFTPDGLPLGIQLVGALGDEASVLAVGDAYQRATAWHLASPADSTHADHEGDHR